MGITDEFLIGKRERMSWIIETSYGSGGTMSSGEVVGLDCTIEPNWSQGWQEVLTAGADDRNVQARVKGPKTLPYTMTFIPVNWRWMKYLFDVADADDSGTKTHTFTVANSLNSYKLEWAKRHTTAHVLTVAGNFCKSATMRFAKATGEGNDGYVKVSMECVGQDDSQGSSVTSISNITKTGFQFRMAKWVVNSSEYQEVNNGEVTMEVGVDENDSRYCNTSYDNLIADPIPKVNRLSGRFNINLKDTSFYDLWAAGTVVGGTNTFLMDRDGSGNDQLLVTFTNFVIHSAVAPTTIDGVTNTDIIWTADSATIVARDDITTY